MSAQPIDETGLPEGDQRIPEDAASALEGFAPEHRGAAHESSVLSSLLGTVTPLPQADRLDTQAENYDLEVRCQTTAYVVDYLLHKELSARDRALAPLLGDRHCVDVVSNQFASRLVEPFLDDDAEQAFRQYRALAAHTTDEELALLLNKRQFDELHGGLQKHLESMEPAMRQAVAARLAPSGDIQRNDLYQFRSLASSRSLDAIKRDGIVVSIEAEALEVLQRAAEAARFDSVPMSERLKNQRIAVVNGFEGSKLSLAVHDSIDHAWTFALLESRGVLDKFREVMESIGDPAHTDIYKREGEAVASIAFGLRYWALVKPGYVPLTSASELLQHFDSMFDQRLLDDRHDDAYRHLRALVPYSAQWQSLGFTFSNYMVELSEQRRKHGKIKQRDSVTKQVTGELDVMGPDYLAFFVEAHHQLVQSRNKHRDHLLRFQLLLEEYLSELAAGRISFDQPLCVRVDAMRDVDFSEITLPPSYTQMLWMRG